MVDNAPNWPQVHIVLKAYCEQRHKENPHEENVELRSHDYNYLKTWWRNFIQHGSVADADRSGRPHKISKEDALIASEIVKAGRLVTHTVKGKTVGHLVHYTSIAEAVKENATLQQLVQDRDITPEQLLHAMHFHDPDLVRRKIFFKHSFTAEQLSERVQYAKDRLQTLRTITFHPQHIIFIDESSIVINKHTKSDVYVWCDKHDINFSDVCHRKLPKEKSVTVRFIVAVSAHPAFAAKGGLVYMDFTTGTTNIKRRHNTKLDGSQRVGDWKYRVSLLHCVQPAVAICISVATAVGGQQQQRSCVWQQLLF